MTQFNYSALYGRMREKNMSQEAVATASNMSLSQLSAKLKGRYPFKQTDIQGIAKALDIPPVDIGRYFFTV